MLNKNFARDFLELMANEYLPKALKENWDKEVSPEDKKWRPPGVDNNHLLRRTGHMQDNLEIKIIGDDSIGFSTSDIGGYHQFGTSRMEARPWLGFPEDMDLTELVERSLVK